VELIRVDSQRLIDFCREGLERAGIRPEDAQAAAEILVECDMRGVASHGVVALPHYITQMQKGGIDTQAEPKILREGPAYAVIDAGAGMGQVSAYKGTRLAIEKAKATGLGMVTIRNSNHFGAGASYVLMCAREGMIGEAVSNAPAMMSITGGKGRSIGNNPLAMAAPAGKHPPVVLDMAMSVVAAGKIVNYASAGQSIPEGWLLDREGNPTTDPNNYIPGGSLIPFGGYKGYGLAFFVEVLAGVLSGAGITKELVSWRLQPDTPTKTGHTIRAVNIEALMEREEFLARIDRLIDEMHNTPTAPGVDRIYVPGEIEHLALEEAKKIGVGLSPTAFNGLAEMAERLNMDFPF
jgi:L-2-hydroxycarboxylate dehydrogenase (NAD+)